MPSTEVLPTPLPHASHPSPAPGGGLGGAQTRLLTAKRSRGLGTDFLALFSRLRQAPQRIPAEAKGIAAVNNAATSAIKCQIEVTGAVLVSTRWSRAVGAGRALSRSRLSGGKHSRITWRARSYRLKSHGKSHAQKHVWKNQKAIACTGVSEYALLLCKIFTTCKDVFSLPSQVFTGCLSEKGCCGLYSQDFKW